MLAGLKALGLVVSLKEFAAGPTVAELAVLFGNSSPADIASPELSDGELPGARTGLVWQVQSSDSLSESARSLWMIHDGGGLGNECAYLDKCCPMTY